MSQPLTSDGHMNLGHTTDIPMPDRFTAPDTGRVVPQQMGAVAADEVDNELFHGGCYDDDATGGR